MRYKNLSEAFKMISLSAHSEIIEAVIEYISKEEISTLSFRQMLNTYQIKSPLQIKPQLMELFFEYVELILADNYLSDIEMFNIHSLKLLFKIREGELKKFDYERIKLILENQLSLIYEDGVVTKEEALQKVELQRLFDLSYDNFYAIVLNCKTIM